MQTREITVVGDVGYLLLTKGRTALIDADMAPAVGRHLWYAHEVGELCYAARTAGAANRLLHREIMGAEPGQIVDHIDGDGLNNRRSNLRFATHQENLWNARKKKPGLPRGVIPYAGGYVATLTVNGVIYQVGGLYETPDRAAEVRNLFASKIRGDFHPSE